MVSFKRAAVACAFATASGQFLTTPTDLTTTTGNGYTVRYKEVPDGICETTPGVKSYSGYVDVEQNQHIFFWFFEARNVDPSTAPFTIWLNGGPGDPSMVGLFSDNGPCWVDHDGKLQNNPYSWSSVSNMIYIDQPTQVGFSYSIPVNGYIDSSSGALVTVPNDTCPDYALVDACGTYSNGDPALTANSTPNAAPNVWKTLQGFMGAFEQYCYESVHLSTESYGGHYGPIFVEYFETQNAACAGEPINLKGLSVGNGWYDPRIQYPAYYNYTVDPGNTYNYAPFNKSTEVEMYNLFWGAGNCVDRLAQCNSANATDEICSSADDFCYNVEIIFDNVTGRDEDDIRELSPDPFPYTNFVAYLNTPKVQEAIGAYVNFSYSVTNLGTGTTANAFAATGDDARAFDIIGINQRLLDQGIYILQYAGDADYNCNWLGGEAVATAIAAAGWRDAGYENITTPDGIVHGVVKQTSKFSFVRVYEAGHSVPFYKPLTALKLFERMVRGTDIATGEVAVSDQYRSTGPARSTYVEGNSTIQEVAVDPSCTYDTRTNVPECSNATTSKRGVAPRSGVADKNGKFRREKRVH